MQRIVIAGAFVAAAIFLAASATVNSLFLASLGRTQLEILLFIAISIAADLAKAILPILLVWAWTNGQRAQLATISVLLAVLVLFSVSSGIGFAAMTRGSVTADRAAATRTLQERSQELAALEQKIAAAAATRTTGVIEEELKAALVDRNWSTSLSCTETRQQSQRTYCTALFRLRAELAAAKEADRARDQASTLRMELAALRSKAAGGIADPQLAAVAEMLAADPRRVRLILTLALALVLELGAVALMLVVAGASQDRRHAEPDAPATVAPPKSPSAAVPLPAKARQWVKRQDALKARVNGKEADDARS